MCCFFIFKIFLHQSPLVIIFILFSINLAATNCRSKFFLADTVSICWNLSSRSPCLFVTVFNDSLIAVSSSLLCALLCCYVLFSAMCSSLLCALLCYAGDASIFGFCLHASPIFGFFILRMHDTLPTYCTDLRFFILHMYDLNLQILLTKYFANLQFFILKMYDLNLQILLLQWFLTGVG